MTQRSTNPNPLHRRSLRLQGYDYTQAGAYFVTICVHQRACLLGDVQDDKIILNDAGGLVLKTWQELMARFPSVILDEFVVMPNHVHGVVWLSGAGETAPPHQGAASSAPTLAAVVRAFKSLSAIGVNKLLGRSRLFWQRNYYEHVVRNEAELERIREYIINNPAGWDDDEENSARQTVMVRRASVP